MIYAFYHCEGETLGLIGEVLTEQKRAYTEVHLYKDPTWPLNAGEGGDVEALVFMGGPMSVNDTTQYPFLEKEVSLIQWAVRHQVPVLGICLGSQLIAKALGQKVYANKEKEVGWSPIELVPAAKDDPLFKDLPSPQTVLHWHGETFDLPINAIHLAKSHRCQNQAFRFGNNIYGLQFHLEVTEAMVKDWVASAQGRADIQSANEDVGKIIWHTEHVAANIYPIGKNFFRKYFDLFLPATKMATPS